MIASHHEALEFIARGAYVSIDEGGPPPIIYLNDQGRQITARDAVISWMANNRMEANGERIEPGRGYYCHIVLRGMTYNGSAAVAHYEVQGPDWLVRMIVEEPPGERPISVQSEVVRMSHAGEEFLSHMQNCRERRLSA